MNYLTLSIIDCVHRYCLYNIQFHYIDRPAKDKPIKKKKL